MNYIIGAGAAAAIVAYHKRSSKVIAPSEGNRLPIQVIWQTPASQKAIQKHPELNAKTRVIKYATVGEQIEKYNLLTGKPKDSVPSKGMSGSFPVVDVAYPTPKINFIMTVDAVFPGFIFMHSDNCIKLDPKDKVYVASPITFRVAGNKPHHYVEYSSIYSTRVYEPAQVPAGDWDYCYLLEDQYLDRGIYRITKKGGAQYEIESKKPVHADTIANLFEAKKVEPQREIPFANFKEKHPIPWDNQYIPITRASTLNHEWLLSDIYEVL